jgi:hypothetical protein
MVQYAVVRKSPEGCRLCGASSTWERRKITKKMANHQPQPRFGLYVPESSSEDSLFVLGTGAAIRWLLRKGVLLYLAH